MFIPATREEVRKLGWDRLDIILVTGDAYVDSPNMGSAVIGQVLMDRGYRVGIISQPDTESDRDISRLGEPLLYWGVTAGSVDSMISNYTALMKRRMRDDLTPGGENTRRPDRALIVYTNLIRRYFRNTAPVVLGGIEASLRRIAHYDAKDNRIRRSVLFDAKADVLVYGMGERASVELAENIQKGLGHEGVRGTCTISREAPEGYMEIPSFESAASDSAVFEEMFRVFCENSEAPSASGMLQRHGDRFLVHNPPQEALTSEELDRVYELPYERELHPLDRKRGDVRALDTIRFSITSHRGCVGECSFCSIAVHQGRRIISRSEESILGEAEKFSSHPVFRGIINDVGGPTANMYGMDCTGAGGTCTHRSCIYPAPCTAFRLSHERQIKLLKRLRSINGIRRVFVSSGVRHDLILADREFGEAYLEELMRHHVSGQMKIAPEHSENSVLRLMRKPGREALESFILLFNRLRKKTGSKIFLTYYFIAAHPGCTMDDMKKLKKMTAALLKIRPKQVQVFTPSPSTWSTLMYWTGTDPVTGRELFVERDRKKKETQKKIVTGPGK